MDYKKADRTAYKALTDDLCQDILVMGKTSTESLKSPTLTFSKLVVNVLLRELENTTNHTRVTKRRVCRRTDKEKKPKRLIKRHQTSTSKSHISISKPVAANSLADSYRDVTISRKNCNEIKMRTKKEES